MVFTIGTLFEAALLLVNAIAILNEERFLAKVGWGKDFRNEGFGDRGGVKYQLVNLISSVQTLLRVPLMVVNVIVIIYELILG